MQIRAKIVVFDPFLGVGLSDCSAMVHVDNTEWSSQLGN